MKYICWKPHEDPDMNYKLEFIDERPDAHKWVARMAAALYIGDPYSAEILDDVDLVSKKPFDIAVQDETGETIIFDTAARVELEITCIERPDDWARVRYPGIFE